MPRCGWRCCITWRRDRRCGVIYTYQYEGESYTLRLEAQGDGRFVALIGGENIPLEAHRLRDDGWLLVIDGRQAVVYSGAQGNVRYLHFDGQEYTLTAVEARGGRRRGTAGEGDLTAQMPGQVLDVLVGEGQAVTRGQTLVILEAMKMEIRVSAPGDGQVQRVLVKKGDVVERGQHLVEIVSR
jgi:biotin carboxyl carrier protein